MSPTALDNGPVLAAVVRLRLHRSGGVVIDSLEEAFELYVDRNDAERVVQNWNRDEPDRAGELRVEPIELETAPTRASAPNRVSTRGSCAEARIWSFSAAPFRERFASFPNRLAGTPVDDVATIDSGADEL